MNDPRARPPWWRPYELPPELKALIPVPDSRFSSSDRTGRLQGGLFSLDGVHPTTIAYGILAQEFIRIMELAGVEFPAGGRYPSARPDHRRLRPAHRPRLARRAPAISVAPDLRLIGWLDERLDVLRRMIRIG